MLDRLSFGAASTRSKAYIPAHLVEFQPVHPALRPTRLLQSQNGCYPTSPFDPLCHRGLHGYRGPLRSTSDSTEPLRSA